MKKRISFAVAVWWVVLMAVLGIFLLSATDKHARESEAENRMLRAFPEISVGSVADASFMNAFEDYLSDAFFGRAKIKNLTSRMTGAFRWMSEDDRMDKATADMEKKLAAEGAAEGEPAQIPEDEPETPALPAGEELLTDAKSYLWLKNVNGENKILYEYPLQNIQTYAETLNIMLSYLPEDGQIYFTQAPLASIARRWINQPEVYRGWGSSMETMLKSNISSERIHVFNTLTILEQPLSEGRYLFYRTDHHWSAEGAYLVAKEMLASQGIPVAPYDEFEYKIIKSEVNEEGEQDTFEVLYPLLPTHSLIVTHRDDAEEISLMNYKSVTYRAYMNNSREPWRRIVTGANTGRRALVICDSYGNAFTPYLLPYYDEVHMTDFRKDYFDKELAGGSIGDLMRYHQIDDVYLIISTSNDLTKNNSLVYLRSYLVN